MDRSRPVRLLRSALVTGAILSLAAGAHLVAGQTLPAPALLLLLTALLLVPVSCLAQRQLSFTSLVLILGAGQVLLHEAFTAFAAPGPCRSIPHDAGSQHGASSLDCPGSAPSLMAHDSFGDAPSLALFGGHLAAVVLTAWVMRRGEAALWLLVAWLRPLTLPAAAVVLPPTGPRSVTFDDTFLPSPWRNLRTDSRRGPPSISTVCAAPA